MKAVERKSNLNKRNSQDKNKHYSVNKTIKVDSGSGRLMTGITSAFLLYMLVIYPLALHDHYFDITYTNLNSDLYMIDSSTNIKYTLKESTIKKYKNGQTIKFVFYSKTCNNEYIGERSVSLKKYNKYYKSEYCKDILEYEYCAKWMNNNIPVAEFKRMTDDYRTKISKPVTEEVDNYKTDIQGFYLFIAIIEFILFVTFISIFKQKRAKDII